MSQPSNPSTAAAAAIGAASQGAADSYIVMLKEDSDQSSHVQWLRGLERKYRSTTSLCELTHEYQVFKGYAATLNGEALQEVTDRPDVEAIVQDNEVEQDTVLGEDETEKDDGKPPYDDANEAASAAKGEGDAIILVQRNATWGLQRISQRNRLPPGSNPLSLNYTYRWEKSLYPPAVDVYVLDTGVYLEHYDLLGRARRDKNCTKYPDGDVRGHGSHVAGTVAGMRFGAAKPAVIIDVKVLGDNGKGWTSDIIAGINWSVGNAASTGRSSVINMSLGGSQNVALDRASTNAVRRGVHVCVSAGNKNTDAMTQSPARAQDVFTVGATTIDDARSSFSNYGPALDIFAPGSKVISCGITSPTAHVVKSGTSMASPHVAGVVAYILYLNGKNIDHNTMLARLRALGVPNVLSNIPPDTVNLLLNNGVPLA